MKLRARLAIWIPLGVAVLAGVVQLIRVVLLSSDAGVANALVLGSIFVLALAVLYFALLRPLQQRSRSFRLRYDTLVSVLNAVVVFPGWLWNGANETLQRFATGSEKVPVQVVVSADSNGIAFTAASGNVVARMGWAEIDSIETKQRSLGGPQAVEVIVLVPISDTAAVAISPGSPRGKGFGYLRGTALEATVSKLQRLRMESGTHTDHE